MFLCTHTPQPTYQPTKRRLDRRVPAKEKEARVLELIEDVGLDGKEDQRVGGPLPGGLSVRGLSGGEKRRLSLVRCRWFWG